MTVRILRSALKAKRVLVVWPLSDRWLARTGDERANWLRLAEGWLGLLREQTDEEAFDIKAAPEKPGRTIRNLFASYFPAQNSVWLAFG
jgi:hypothetical protein